MSYGNYGAKYSSLYEDHRRGRAERKKKPSVLRRVFQVLALVVFVTQFYAEESWFDGAAYGLVGAGVMLIVGNMLAWAEIAMKEAKKKTT